MYRGIKGRRPNVERLMRIFDIIMRFPGIKPGGVGELMGCADCTVVSALPTLERVGLLVSEDEEGGLWPFDVRLGSGEIPAEFRSEAYEWIHQGERTW